MPEVGVVNLKEEILGNLHKFHTELKFPDVHLMIDGVALPAHRIILAAQSKVLENLVLGEGFKESKLSEIPIVASFDAMTLLLTFLYSGELDLRCQNLTDVLDLFELAHRFELVALEQMVADFLTFAVTIELAAPVLQFALLIGHTRLVEQCWTLISLNIQCIHDTALVLPYPLMLEFMDRRSTNVSEVNKFEMVHRMITQTDSFAAEQKASLISRIDFRKMTTAQLVKAVVPTKLISNSYFLTLMKQPHMYESRVLDKLTPIPKFVRVTNGFNPHNLFQSDSSLSCFHHLGGGQDDFISLDLKSFYIINHIKFNIMSYWISYIIEYSRDGTEWIELINFSQHQCAGQQSLYFADTVLRYVKLKGVRYIDKTCEKFEINSLRIWFEEKPLRSLGSYLVPYTNVATLNKCVVNFFSDLTSNYELDVKLINGQIEDKGVETPYTTQIIANKSLLIQFDQPYVLSSCRFRLWDYDGRMYGYIVRVTHNEIDYDIISDTSDELVDGWQCIKFSPRVVVQFNIRPTRASNGNELRLVHFEAPMERPS